MNISTNLINILLIFLVSLITNLLVSIPLIKLLQKKGFYKTKKTSGVDISKRNSLWYNHLEKSLDTPASYGILLIPNFLVLLTIGFDNKTFFITILYTILFLFIGLYDDLRKYFYFLKTNKWGLSVKSQLLLQMGITLTYLLIVSPNVNLILIVLSIPAIVFILNSYNITDGLDGLVGSITLIILPVLMLFEYISYGQTMYILLYTVLLGFFTAFLYFNWKPSKVFFGDVGTYAIGFIFGIILFRYNFFATTILFSLFILEGLSSFVQMIAIRFYNHKVFKIAPYHLHLLNSGWSDIKIVKTSIWAQILISCISFIIFYYAT